MSALLLALATTPAFAQDTLPPGEGMEATVKACGGCHGVGTFRSVRRSASMWDVTISNMIGFGMSDFDYDTVWTYLSTYLGLTPPPLSPPPASPPPSQPR